MDDALLVLDDVSKRFRRGRRRWQILSGVSIAVHAGEHVGVVGGRGEGKTTLLEIAAGIELPDEGRVLFAGGDLTSCSTDARADLLGDRIAWMPRETSGDFEAIDCVGLPLAMGRGARMRDADDRAMTALEYVGVANLARRRWNELSNWEQVLVTFARGFATMPDLMVIDDLLDGLGSRRTREANDFLRSFTDELGCGVLVAASDLDSVLLADRVLCFQEGSVASMSPALGVVRIDRDRPMAQHKRA